MLKDIGRGELLAGIFLWPDYISASSLLCIQVDSWGSSLVSKAVHVTLWNWWTCTLSHQRAWLSRARLPSVCNLSFANGCHSTRWKIRVWAMSLCLGGSNPSNTGIVHYTRMLALCYDCFFSFNMLYPCTPFSLLPCWLPSIFSDFYLHQSVLSRRLRSSSYSSIPSHSFPFYNDAFLWLGQALLGPCTFSPFYINRRTSCILSLTLTYLTYPWIYQRSYSSSSVSDHS